MGKIYYLMGKSSSGKDTIYKKLCEDKSLNLKTITGYTTRPIRDGEVNGREYFFVDRDYFNRLVNDNMVIEYRNYNTVYGIWTYFTVDDGQINLKLNDYILIGTLESYEKVSAYFGSEKVVPVYIYVDDGERLMRALTREMNQKEPKYEEMCRRFLADSRDFSKENIEKFNIKDKYENKDLNDCIKKISDMIKYHHRDMEKEDTLQ